MISASICCWRVELISKEDGSQSQIDASKSILDTYKQYNLPSQVGDVKHLCINNWVLMYPNAEIPSGFTYYNETTGLTWKGHCDSALYLKMTLLTVLAQFLIW